MKIKGFKLDGIPWRIKYDKEMLGAKINCGPGEYDGVCLPETKLITLDPNAGNLSLTFKHELVHSILYTMNNKLAYDEDFVNRFSELLLESEVTLKLERR